MDKIIKLAGIFAGIAFLFSFLFGLLGPVSFGIVFLRAILFAAFFAFVGAGIAVVFDRFLSVANDNNEFSNREDSFSGKRLNMVSDDNGLDDDEDDEIPQRDVQPRMRSSDDSSSEIDQEVSKIDAGIDLEALSGFESGMSDLDSLSENFESIRNNEVISHNMGISIEETDSLDTSSAFSSSKSSGSSRSVSQDDFKGDNMSPGEYAKVIKTLLKKDEKG